MYRKRERYRIIQPPVITQKRRREDHRLLSSRYSADGERPTPKDNELWPIKESEIVAGETFLIYIVGRGGGVASLLIA